jgi:hypothetical protein
MAANQEILHGGRATLIVNGKTVGVFTQCSWGVNYDVNAAFILGRMSPAELTYTGQDVINISATGYRVVGNGPYAAANVPMLQNLLTFQEISLSVYDRQTNQLIMTVVGVKPVGFSTGIAARSVSDFQVTFQGRILSDESGTQDEAAGASTLDSGT